MNAVHFPDWQVYLLATKGMKIAKETAKFGARTVTGVIGLVLKIIGTVILIGISTMLVFACIFSVYCKTNFSTGLDVEYDDFSQSLSSVIYAKNSLTGKYEEAVTLTGSEYRMWVDYDDIPKHVEHALVSIEDKRFYKHNGVDWYRTSGAFVNMFLSMSNTFGGSTITQQLLKNITGDNDVTVQRKFREIFRALEFEKQYDKDEIICWYLNAVYFGHGCYGIGAAARYYFGVEASKLTAAQAACIVGITNNPSIYSPFIDKEANKKRQLEILAQMYDQEYLTEAEYNRAKNEELVFDYGDSSKTDKVYTWFEEALRKDVITDLARVKNVSEETAELMLLTGGYKIYSTVDPRIQDIIDSVYENTDNISDVSGSSQQAQSAIVVIDPYTGDIVGMSGGVGEKTGNLWWNRATMSKRQPGSSIKPIASYAPAIEYGIVTPDTKIQDAKEVKLEGTSWMTLNFDHSYQGVITIAEALKQSINTVAAQLVDKLSPAVSFEFLRSKAGISTLTIEDQDYAPMAVGGMSYGVTVRDMASAYTMFVNNGIRSKGRTYSAIYDNDDNLVYENKTEQVVAITEKTAYWMTKMMQASASYGTGGVANLSNMPVGGKTGTTQDKFDRWFCGFTPYYVAAVWTGYDNPTRIIHSGNPSANMWKKVMSQIHDGLEYRSFNVPADTYLTPIPGVVPIDIYIRGVDELGNEIYYEQGYDGKSCCEGNEIEIEAPVIEGYTLISPESKISYTVVDPETIGEDGINVIEFVYKSDEPIIDPFDPIDPFGPQDPEQHGEDPEEGGGFLDNLLDIFG